MNAACPDVSVVIVAWNHADSLRRCIASAQEHFSEINFEIIVADNGSTDGTAEMLAKEFPGVRAIINEKNLGPTRARNIATRAASGRYVLYLDDDIQILGGGIAGLVSFMDSRPDAGIAGARLSGADGKTQLTRRTVPGIPDVMLRRLAMIFPAVEKCGRYRRHHALDRDSGDTLEVGVVIGAFQLARREAIERIGPFDERMFWYFEDIDYCARCLKAGFKVVYNPCLDARHTERREGLKSIASAATWHLIRSFAIYYMKHGKDIAKINRRNPVKKIQN